MRAFISYSSRDRVEALQMKRLIERLGHEAWMDVFDVEPAARLAAALMGGVSSAEMFVILTSHKVML